VRLALEAWEVTRSDTPALLLTEVVTNAILHAKTTVSVRLFLHADRLRAEVDDASMQPPARRFPTQTATGGRGLLLLDRLASGWGHIVDAERGGKTVWFEVPIGEPDPLSGADRTEDRDDIPVPGGGRR
jgi:two-component sensor histidine kinase